MKGLIPFGSLTISGPGSQTILLGTGSTLFNLFSSTGGANGPATTKDDGDPAVVPDVANNRILVEAPGVYEVSVTIGGTVDAAQDIVCQVAKNTVGIADMVGRQRFTNAVKNTLSFEGFVNVVAGDNPGTIATKSDPSTTGFAGSGGFPKQMVPLTLLLSSLAGTPTLTAEYVNWTVKRVG